jgi:WD40 repeat protein
VAAVTREGLGKGSRPKSITETFEVWDIVTGKPVAVRGEHPGRASCVAFGAGEDRLLVGDDAGRVRLWSLDRGKSSGAFDKHQAPVTCVAASLDGTRALSGDEKGGVYLWDANTFAVIDRREDHVAKVSSVAFSADGTWLYSASEFDPLVRWRPGDRSSEHVYKGHAGGVKSAALSPDRKAVVTCGTDGRLILWDGTSGEVVRRWPSRGATRAYFSGDGSGVLTVDSGGVSLWDVMTGELTRRSAFEGLSVVCSAQSPVGKYVALGTEDGTVLVLERSTGKELRRFRFRYGSVAAVGFAAEEATVLASGAHDSLAEWDVRTGESVRQVTRPFGEPVGVAFTARGRRLLTRDGPTVWLWDLDGGRDVQRFDGLFEKTDWRSEEKGHVFLLSPDGQQLFAVAEDGSAQLRRVQDGGLVRRCGPGSGLASVFLGEMKQNLTWHRDNLGRLWQWVGAAEEPEPRSEWRGIKSLSLSASGIYAAVPRDGGKTALRQLVGAETETATVEVARPVSAFTASAGLARSLTFDRAKPRVVDLWGPGGNPVARLAPHERPVESFALSPDGKFAYTNDGLIRQWSTADGRLVRSFGRSPVSGTDSYRAWNDTRLSPDARWALFPDGRSGQAMIWDLAKKQPVVRISPSPQLSDVDFHQGSVHFHQGSDKVTYRARDGSLRRVDLATRKDSLLVASHPAAAHVAFSPDGRHFAMVEGDAPGKMFLRDVADMNTVRELDVASYWPDPRLIFSGDGRRLLSSDDQTVHLWDVATGKLLRTEACPGGVTALGASPSGRLIAAGSRDPKPAVRVWTLKEGGTIVSLAGQLDAGRVSALAFSPDDRYLATIEALKRPWEQSVRVWEWARGKQAGEVPPSTSAHYCCIAFAPGGKSLAVGLHEGAVCLYEFPGLRLIRRFGAHRGPVTVLQFSADGRLLATGGDDRAVRVWNVATGEQARQLSWHSGSVLDVNFHPDGQTVLTASRDDPAVVWRPGEGTTRPCFEGLSDSVVPHITPDGRRAVLVHRGGLIRVWDFEQGAEIARFTGHTGTDLLMVLISHDGNSVYSVGGGEACYWDAATGAERWRIKGRQGLTRVAAFSPDDRSLIVLPAFRNFPRARLIDTRSGRLAEFPMEGQTTIVNPLAFSPDGSLVASGGSRPALWDVPSGREKGRHSAHSDLITSVAFTGDGASVVSSSSDLPAFAWGVKENRGWSLFEGHATPVAAFAVSADGDRLVTGGGRDESACVWDTATGRLLQRFFGHGAPVTAVALSANGSLALTGGGGGRPTLGRPVGKGTRLLRGARRPGHGPRVLAQDAGAVRADRDGGWQALGMVPRPGRAPRP